MKNKNQFTEYRDLIPFVDPAQKFSHSETVIRNKLILGTTFGIWFWPYGWFSDRAKTARQLGPERLGSLIRELLDQAAKDRILPCL